MSANNNNNKEIKASLTCVGLLTEYKSDENAQKDWQQCLSNIDSAIGQIYDDIVTNSAELVVISIPFQLTHIHQTIEHSISEQLPSNCFEVITEFMFPSKNWIQQILTTKSKSSFLDSNNRHNIQQSITNNNNNNNNINIDTTQSVPTWLTNSNEVDLWTVDKHDDLLKSEAIIIINTKNGRFKSVPRNIIALIPDYNSNNKQRNWSLTWSRSPSQEKHKYNQIYSIIGHHIGCISFPEYFHLAGDWSFKTDFSDVEQCGYLCDDGNIAFGDVCKQNSYTSKIFICYNEKSSIRGLKYEWINVPSYRLCGPSLDDIYKKNKKKTKGGTSSMGRCRDLSTFYCSAPGTKPRRRRSQYDTDMAKAIAASLGKEYEPPVEDIRQSRRNYNDGEDLQRALAASLGQEYIAGQKFNTDDGNVMDTDNGDQRENGNENVNNNDRNGDWNMNSLGASSTNFEDEIQKAIAASLKEMEVDNDGTNQNENGNENENRNENDTEMTNNDNNNDKDKDDDNVEREDVVVEERRNDDRNNNGNTSQDNNNNNNNSMMMMDNMTGNNNNNNYIDWANEDDALQRAIAESLRQ